MKQERSIHGLLVQPGFEVFGSGPVGEKAGQLMAKKAALEQMGFCFPHRCILANDLIANASGSRVSTQLRGVVEHISGTYPSVPLVVRSSAEGDSRGTGVYASVYALNSPASILRALRYVRSSYASRDARAFRARTGLGNGFAVMIEPMVGQEIGNYYMPLLSGFAYTSTGNGEGYAMVVPGLGSSVSVRYGERITPSEWEKTRRKTVGSYIYERDRDEDFPNRTLLRTFLHGYESTFPMQVFDESAAAAYEDYGIEPDQARFEMTRDEWSKILGVDLCMLFRTFEPMERRFGHPQYFEWAIAEANGKPVIYMLQIADVDRNIDQIEFGEFGNPMFTAHTVTGSGIREVSSFVCCYNESDIPLLEKYNRTHKGYGLIYPARLITSSNLKKRIGFSDYSHASVFIEIPDKGHANNPVAHLSGQLNMAGILFGVLDSESGNKPDWDTFAQGSKKYGAAFEVYDSPLTVVSSEIRNKLVVYRKEQ